MDMDHSLQSVLSLLLLLLMCLQMLPPLSMETMLELVGQLHLQKEALFHSIMFRSKKHQGHLQPLLLAQFHL